MILRTAPPLVGGDPEFARAVAAQRQLLLLFYQAALNGAAGHRELWARDIATVLAGDPHNPYYRWFVRSGD